jgi:predicted nucleic-acid-binding protein
MIGIDTNILVRYLVNDDPVQSPRAAQIIERRLNEDNPGYISIVTIVETAWVLRRRYRFSSDEVASAIERVLLMEAFLVEHEVEVYSAMFSLRDGRSSFSDALIGKLDAKAGCSVTLTFDRKASRLAGFELA